MSGSGLGLHERFQKIRQVGLDWKYIVANTMDSNSHSQSHSPNQGFLCPGTRAGAKIRGQTPLSRDIPGQNHYLNVKKNVKKFSNFVINYFFLIIFPFLSVFFRNVLVAMVNIKVHSENGKKKEKKIEIFFFYPFSFISVPRDVPGRLGTGRDRQSKSRLGPSHGKILRLSSCPFVPGQVKNLCPFAPKSCTVPSRWKPQPKPNYIPYAPH